MPSGVFEVELPTLVLIVDENEEFRRVLVQALAPILPSHVQLRTAFTPERESPLVRGIVEWCAVEGEDPAPRPER